MLRWTLKSLIAEPWHLGAGVAAIGSAFALVLFFEAVFAGEARQIVAYLRHTAPAVWVMQDGVSNMHMTTSFVTDWKAGRIERIPGVRRVTPILYVNTVLRAGEGSWFSFVVGLDAGDARAGPWAMACGEAQPLPGEAVVPEVLARLAGLDLGDPVEIGGQGFHVAGLSEGTFSMANSVSFVTMDDLAGVMSSFATFSYLLVDAAPGVGTAELAERIRSAVDKVSVVTNEAFMENDWEVAMQMGVEIIEVMTLIGGALAALLTGFAVYTSTVRRQRELAVMKALGVRDRALYGSVLLQAAVVVALGLAAGTALVLAAAPLAARFAPVVSLQVTGEAVLRLTAVAALVALVAAAVPLHRVLRVDPVTAFRD